MKPVELVLPDAARTNGDGPAARTNGDGPDVYNSELTRLRTTCRRHEHAIEGLTQALLRLRVGTAALKEENAELRAEIASMHRRLSSGG
jgi:hypothetical protein